MKLVIQLTENDRIMRFNQYNLVYETLEDRLDKDGAPKQKWVAQGYYSTLSSALQAVPDHMIMVPKVKTIADLFSRWRDACETLESLEID